MFKNRNLSVALLPFIAALAGVGCHGGEDAESFVGLVEAPEMGEGAQPARADSAEASAVLAELRVDERATVRFVDERQSVPGGGVGVLVVGAPHLSATYKELGLTPLELYMALAPEASVPELLREDHRAALEARGLAAVEPREVSFEAGALSLEGQPSRVRRHDPSAQSTAATDCTYVVGVDEPGYWADTWCSATAPSSDWCATQFGLTGNRVVVAGTASERWLAACNDSNISNATISWVVQVDVSAGSWAQVAGTSVTLAKDFSVNYHSSGGVLNYRALITAGSTVVYQVGAARN